MRPAYLKLAGTLLLACGLVVLDSVAGAANWPRFRGPNGAGTAADKNIPVEWTEKNFLWKTALPGTGNSSPVIWGDKIFLQSSDAKNRMVVCLNVKDGKVAWTKTESGGIAKTHTLNTLGSSTPATDGEHVYCYFWDGKQVGVSAYDFAGKRVWHHDLGGFESQHGAGASPVVVDGKVIVNHDQDGKAELVALDVKTGKPVWQTKRDAFRACYTTPFVLERQGATELICASTSGITSYDPKTGSANWNWAWTWTGQPMPLRTVGSPVANGDLIFIGAGDGSGARQMAAVHIGGSGMAWEHKRPKVTPYVPCPLIHGDHVFYVNDYGYMACLDAKTGKEVWNERLPGAGNVFASPLLVDGKIYAVADNGTVYVVEAAPQFKLLAKNSVGEPVMATPAVADGRLYIRGKSTLFCIGSK